MWWGWVSERGVNFKQLLFSDTKVKYQVGDAKEYVKMNGNESDIKQPKQDQNKNVHANCSLVLLTVNSSD